MHSYMQNYEIWTSTILEDLLNAWWKSTIVTSQDDDNPVQGVWDTRNIYRCIFGMFGNELEGLILSYAY